MTPVACLVSPRGLTVVLIVTPLCGGPRSANHAAISHLMALSRITVSGNSVHDTGCSLLSRLKACDVCVDVSVFVGGDLSVLL